jgi:toxin CptA
MSSTASDAALRLDLRPSRGLALFLAATHSGAALCLLVASVPPWASACGLLALSLSLVRELRRHVLRRHPRAVVRLLAGTEGEWTLGLADGTTVAAERLPGTVVHPWLVVLHLRSNGPRRRWSVPIAADALDPDSHRRLRVRLNLETLAEAP